MVALNLHPAVGAPPAPPAGNRRGAFAATPEGHRGASGTPGSDGKSNGNGAGKKNGGDLPSGLYVGTTSTSMAPVAGDPAPKNPNYVNPKLIANARPPRIRNTPTGGRPQTLGTRARRLRQPESVFAQPQHAEPELRRGELDHPLRRAQAGCKSRECPLWRGPTRRSFIADGHEEGGSRLSPGVDAAEPGRDSYPLRHHPRRRHGA